MSTVVTNESWFSRIGGAIKGLLIGAILTVVSVPILFWNEGRAVYTAKGLEEGAGAVVTTDSTDVLPENEGKFVHVTGQTTTEDILRDDDFGIEFNGIRLNRKAEMYQWVEHKETKSKKKLGGGKKKTTTYTYDMQWSDRLVSSGSFHKKSGHENPTEMLLQSKSSEATNVSLGEHKLPGSLIGQIRQSESVEIEKERIDKSLIDNIIIQNEGNQSIAYYRSNEPYDGTPKLGDTRVTFTATPTTIVSLMSKQSGDTFQPYVTQFDTQLNMLQVGTVAPEAMIAKAEADNARLTWILRGLGAGMMFFGFTMIFRPLSVLADVIPIFGSFVGFGAGVIAFLLAGAGSLITISIAWLFYRPILGITLLVIAAVLLGFAFMRMRSGSRKSYAADETNFDNPNALSS